MIRFLGLILMIALWGSLLTTTKAQDAGPDLLQQAHQHYEGRDWTAAKASYLAAIHQGTRSPAGLAIAYLRLGLLEASFGTLDEAIPHFARSRAIDPDQDMPADLSPSQRGAFQTAHEGPAASMNVELSPGVGGVTLHARTRHLQTGWVTRFRASTQNWEVSGEDPVMLLPLEAFEGVSVLHVNVEGLDTYGNIVVRTTGEVQSPLINVAAAQPDVVPEPAVDLVLEEETHRQPRTALWIGVGLAIASVVAAAVIIPLALRNTDSPQYGTPVVEWGM